MGSIGSKRRAREHRLRHAPGGVRMWLAAPEEHADWSDCPQADRRPHRRNTLTSLGHEVVVVGALTPADPARVLRIWPGDGTERR